MKDLLEVYQSWRLNFDGKVEDDCLTLGPKQG